MDSSILNTSLCASARRQRVPYTPQSRRRTRDTLEKAEVEEEEELEGGREREKSDTYIVCMHATTSASTAANEHPLSSRLLSIHARRRPIVRRVDNFKTMPTGPAAHCAKITGTPGEKRAKEERKKRERMRIAARSFERKGRGEKKGDG